MIFVNLLIIAILIYAAFTGTKRGMVLLALELASFILATIVALLAYQLVGSVITKLSGVSAPLGNVVGFVLVWIITETAAALLVRFKVLPHLSHRLLLTRADRIGGAVLGFLKAVVIVALSLMVFAGLPLSAGTKNVVTAAYIPKTILSQSGLMQNWLASGLGRDLGQSLNFFTVSASPESEQRIDLGYTTTGTVDPKAEAAMLVLVNHERTSRGLHALTLNTKARSVARAYSAEMFAKGYFSHIDPGGKNPFDRMRAAGISFGTAGENLALAPTLQLAHQGLMHSPPHRANILNPAFRTVGIGIIDGGAYGLMVTQDFTD